MGVLGAGTARKGGLRCGHSPKRVVLGAGPTRKMGILGAGQVRKVIYRGTYLYLTYYVSAPGTRTHIRELDRAPKFSANLASWLVFHNKLLS